MIRTFYTLLLLSLSKALVFRPQVPKPMGLSSYRGEGGLGADDVPSLAWHLTSGGYMAHSLLHLCGVNLISRH